MVKSGRKVEQVAEEADSLRESLDRYMQRQQRKMQEAQERAELLGRAVCILFCLVLYIVGVSVCNSSFGLTLVQNGESSHVLRIFDEEAQAMESARNSSRMLEEASATGAAILAKYSEQRERLKVFPN